MIERARGTHFGHSFIFEKIIFDIACLSGSQVCKCYLAHECFREEISTLASVDFECQTKEGVLSIPVRTSNRECELVERLNNDSAGIAQCLEEACWEVEE